MYFLIKKIQPENIIALKIFTHSLIQNSHPKIFFSTYSHSHPRHKYPQNPQAFLPATRYF